MDPSSPWGYEAKHVALHGARQYDEAIDAFNSMLQVIEQSHDPAVKQLRNNYVSPSETIAAIDFIVDDILKKCPLVVINVTTGYLYDKTERKHSFKVDPRFKKLVSSMTTKVDKGQIRPEVESFFGYVMFSHVWNYPEGPGKEPLFKDVNAVKSVWNLSDEPLNNKLRNFCEETRRLGCSWAWSDTCCIDKTNTFILNQSLKSMYSWYANSAATLVFLADIAHPSKRGDLTRGRWMTRAWTLQELLSPKIILFYDSEWKRYLGNNVPNHKDSPEIKQELAVAIGIPQKTIIAFSPENLGVREKLCLASTRNATVEEDIAYSLIGIFQSDIIPQYGEGADALGHLLEGIVDRTREVTVLAWSGKSSSYYSCLPASISVYEQTLSNLPSLDGEELETRIGELDVKLPRERTLEIYNRIKGRPKFTNRRLELPCVVFPVESLEMPCEGEDSYCAKVSGIGKVAFTAADDLSVDNPQKYVFVHPWIRQLRGPSSGVAWRHSSDIDNYRRALKMIARLGQQFNGWLLVRVEEYEEHKRVATDCEIVLPGLETDIPKDMQGKVLIIQ